MVEFGRNGSQLFHTFRHVERAWLERGLVEAMIQEQLSRTAAVMPEGFTRGVVVVADRRLVYSAYKLPDGSIHVGRITVE